MELKSPMAAAGVVLVLALSACGSNGGGAETGSTAQESAAAAQAAQAQDTPANGEVEPCFTVDEVGTGLTLTWEQVVTARGSSDQLEHVEMLIEDSEEMYAIAEERSPCYGQLEMAEFNSQVSILNDEIRSGADSNRSYENVSDIGDDLLEKSDDQGRESSYEFIVRRQ
ncbi:hypothetical protein GCM10022261_14460 [Brevibacterium daeguense]|uniref:Lipoprotein n=1 Tax=Brevibacterium daeguense TaxID=909936 RepID=A0ABP8EJ51_9MICO